MMMMAKNRLLRASHVQKVFPDSEWDEEDEATDLVTIPPNFWPEDEHDESSELRRYPTRHRQTPLFYGMYGSQRLSSDLVFDDENVLWDRDRDS